MQMIQNSQHFIVSILGVLLFLACHGHSLPDVDCESASPPAFADLTLLDSCTDCHATTLEGAARNGAPRGIDYDDYQAAVENAEHGAAVVNEGSMPPMGAELIPEQDKQSFYEWALCGTP